MGLVLQAPTDALLPLAEATAASAATPAQTAAAADGLFASLLASFAGSLDPQAAETGATEAAPASGDIPLAPEKDGQDESDALAALAALTVSLPQMVLPATPLADSAGGAAGSPIAAASPAVESAPELVEPVAAQGVPGDATSEAPKVAAAPEATMDPVEATAIAGAEQAAALAGDQPVPVEAPKAQEPSPKPVGASPPSEAGPAEGATVASVVRSVGNAETETEGQDGGNASGRKDHELRPLPQASEKSVVNAAPAAVAETRAAQDAAPVDAPAATDAPAPSPEVPPQVEHVARTVIERLERGGGEARIHLDPAGLGEVTIHVHTQGDHVRVEVHAERQEAAQLLRDHTQDLSTLLGDRGLNLSDVNVGLGRGNSEQAWGQDERQGNRPATGEFASILGVGETSALETHNRLRAAYNPDGALVYRV